MKRTKYLPLLLLLVIPCLLFAADGIIGNFTLTSNGKTSVILEWNTLDEQNIQHFEIERAIQGQAFKNIATITPKGYPSTYKYTDEDATSRKSDGSVETKNVYDYRIKVVFNNNSYIYGATQSVSFELSVIKRTWGMIKEMFR